MQRLLSLRASFARYLWRKHLRSHHCVRVATFWASLADVFCGKHDVTFEPPVWAGFVEGCADSHSPDQLVRLFGLAPVPKYQAFTSTEATRASPQAARLCSCCARRDRRPLLTAMHNFAPKIMHSQCCCWPPFSSCLMLCCRDSTSTATWQAQAEQAFHSK